MLQQLPVDRSVETGGLDVGVAAASPPRVAIVGRPNVGKSTLYNRLTRSRRAITDAMPGVTRDTIECEVVLEPIGGVLLIDTGGVGDSTGELDRAVADRSVAEATRADVVLLVVDALDISAADEILIDRLRPFSDKTILVANKLDTEQRDPHVSDLYRLGFSTIVGVSAAHGRHIDHLVAAVAARLAAVGSTGAVVQRPADTKIAILGQPNVGKSSLLNSLLAFERALVSPVAGTTRDVVEGRFVWKNTSFRIMDTAGIRRKARVAEDVEYYSVNRAIATIADADVVFLLIDAERGLSDQDKKIAKLVVDKGRGIVLVISKWDLVPAIKNSFEAFEDRMRFLFPVLSFAPVRAISTVSGYGIPQLLQIARVMHGELNKRCETGPLNQALARWVERTPPPMTGRRAWKIRYITQITTNPVQFVAFVNRVKGFPAGYVSYIQNSIRAELGFQHIPITVTLRERS